MNFKSKYILTPLVLGALAFSCEQREQEEVAPFSAETTQKSTTANLLFNETFEGSSVFGGLNDQFGTSHAFKVATSPVFEGSKSGRFELRDSDPLTSNGTRAEVLFPESSVGKNRWYSFRAYYPSSGYKKDRNNDIINQWHQGGGTGSPSTTLRVKEDRFFMKIGNNKETRKDFDLGVQTKDVWHEFVIHIVHSYGTDGLVEVWHNGNKVLTYKGGNMYDAALPRWKVGIYKDDWNGSETTDTNLRVFYLDNIRMGNEKATYTEMASGAVSTTTTAPAPTTTTTEPAPTTTTTTTSGSSAISGFTLIDAATEKGLFTITDGSSISLSSLTNTKLNIRANTASSVGSIKFELSGAQSKTYVDDAAPYALHGDNGSGNYYYGNWNPPVAGTYTLKATPFSGADATGTAGTPVTIRFTITNTGKTVLGSTTTTATTTTEPAPTTTTTTTTTSGQLVTGFTLIDAATESGVLTITDGATIKLSSLKNTKLNIRANTASSVGSIKFELSGAQSKTYTDSAAPYALHGDNGSGNYYYGNWNPPVAGTYTLKATPFSGADATGTAGTPTTIKFTIVK